VKVILISTAERELNPRVYGGAEVIVYYLAKTFAEKKDEYGIDEVAVACCKKSDIPKGVSYIPTVDPKEDTFHNWIHEDEKAYEIYEPYLKDFDVIVDHSWGGFPYIYKLKNPNVKVTHTFHGMGFFATNPPIWDNPNYIAVSSVQADMIYNALGVEATVIHHGIDMELYLPTENPKGDYLLFLNRIMREKGAIQFIRLCEKLKVCGILAGEDRFVSDYRYVEQVKEMAEKSEYVEYRGRVSFDEKIELLQNAKALIALPMLPYVEVFGLFCTEALACGTPVIALANGGLIDQLSGTVLQKYLCANLVEIERAVKNLLEIKDDTSLRIECRTIAEKRFNRIIMADNYMKKIKSL